MDVNKIKKLLAVASLGLAAGGIILLVIQLMGEGDRWTLSWALLCVAAASMFNVIRMQQTQKPTTDDRRINEK